MSSHPNIEHFQSRLQKLTATDSIRIHKILEILQYSFLYVFVAGFFALLIEKIFPKPNEEESTINIIIQVVLQCMLSAVAVFYIRKITMLVPYIFEGVSGYNPHTVEEFRGEVVLALVFVGIQSNLLTKLEILRKRFIGN